MKTSSHTKTLVSSQKSLFRIPYFCDLGGTYLPKKYLSTPLYPSVGLLPFKKKNCTINSCQAPDTEISLVLRPPPKNSLSQLPLAKKLCAVFFSFQLLPHATPTHFHFSTLSFYKIVCKFSIPCHKFPTLFVEKLLLLRQFDNCND